MQLPDLKAFAYPVPTNVPVEAGAGPNNMYMGRSSVQAQGFVPPFVNEAQEADITPTSAPASFSQKVNAASRGNYAAPGLEFSGTGELAKLDEVMMGNPPVLYKQIAASIRGEALPAAEAAVPSVMRDPLTPLGRAGVISADAAEEGKALERRLYGDGTHADGSFQARCHTALRGVLYDVLHLKDVQRLYGATSTAGAIQVAATRNGRGPYVAFFVLLLILLCVALWLCTSLVRSSTPPRVSYGMPGMFHYAMPYPGPTRLGPLCGWQVPA